MLLDVDECAPERIDRYCPEPGVCTNTVGGYKCVCPPGYDLTSSGCVGMSISSIKLLNLDLTDHSLDQLLLYKIMSLLTT